MENDLTYPQGYPDFLDALKTDIRASQTRAIRSVNSELVLLYWRIGHGILERQQSLGWGAKVIDQLAGDLRQSFPDVHSFSARNFKYMRSFAQQWPDFAFVQGSLAQMP